MIATTMMRARSSTSVNDANTKAVAYMKAGRHQEAGIELAKAMRILSSHTTIPASIGNNQNNVNVNVNNVNVNNTSMTHKTDDTVPPVAPYCGPTILKTNDMVVESSASTSSAIPAFRIESIDVPSRKNGRSAGDLVGCGNQDYLYDRPFVIAPSSSPSLTDASLCEHYRTETSAVLLFNTALANHQRGILVGTNDGFPMHHHLTNAESTYHMILAMIATDEASLLLASPTTAAAAAAASATDTDTDAAARVWWARRHPSLAVLSMAVSNNLAQIYVEQLDQALLRSTRALLRSMLQEITWTLQVQQEEAEAQYLSEHLMSHDEQESDVNYIIYLEDFTFFHLNLFCLEREDFVVSPAA
jgi:hypothetical protein